MGIDNPDPSSLVGPLIANPAAIGLLALCCGERLSGVALSLAGLQSASNSVQIALDLGWKNATGGNIDYDAISAAISDLEDLADSPDFEVARFQEELDDTVACVAYALRAVRGDGVTMASNAVARCRDVYFQIAVRTWPRHDLDTLEKSPIVQDEVKREIREARQIAVMGMVIKSEDAALLRQAAAADSRALVDLLSGERGRRRLHPR